MEESSRASIEPPGLAEMSKLGAERWEKLDDQTRKVMSTKVFSIFFFYFVLLVIFLT